MHLPQFALALAVLSHLLVGTGHADWPQWRGPAGTGHIARGETALSRLPADPKVVWKMKVGEGLASPVAADGILYYFDAVDGKETIHALNLFTTQEVWRATIDNTFKDSQGPAGPRCTPLVDEDRLYAVSCKGELQCLEAKSGRLIWRTNYTNDFGAVFIGEKGNAPGATRHGNNGSPAIDGPFLIANVGGTNGAGVVCFKKKTGEVVWKSQNDQAGYAPPVIGTIAGVKQVVSFTADGLIGLDFSNGELLWRIPIKTAFARHVTTPVIYQDIVVVSSHQVGLMGIRVARRDGKISAEQLWLSKEASMNFSSPVAIQQYLFGLGPARNFVCVDVLTGKLIWSKEGYFTTSADKAHASFIVMGERVLALTDGGQLVLFEGGPGEFRELGRAQICGLNWCNPAYVKGKLYVRDGIKTTGELICVDLLGD